MRNLKKFLALVLAFMMAMSLMITVNAATLDNVEFPDTESVIEAFQEDVIVMSGMGVIQGHADTGTFAPKAVVTRAQMAAIVYRLATGDAADARTNLYIHEGDFKDVKADAWYAGYVGYCANAGYIVGYPDGNFKPNEPVSGYAALVMILRAMGYNEPGHKFEGSTWKTLAASTATERGMLVKINQTIYANTLNQGAPRELVAEMAFQGATKTMVQWTNAYGYQTGDHANNDLYSDYSTLGRLNYGLTNRKGVVVGNEATGEGAEVTKIGFSLPYYNSPSNRDPLYIYADGRSAYVTATDKSSSAENVTIKFKWNSGLEDFGHAVDVWYDNRSSELEYVGSATPGLSTGYPTNLNTYAVFDRSTLTKVVYVPDDTALDLEAAATTGATPANIKRAAAGAGFSMSGTGDKTYWNYSFGPTLNTEYTKAPTTVSTFSSPIKENNSANKYPLYLLISNSADNNLDMVISLDLTITQITQQNNVAAPYTVGVYNANGGNKYFDNGDSATVAPANYVNIAQKNLVGNSVGKSINDLGTKVAAIEITGTNNPGGNPATNVGTNVNDGTLGEATKATGMNSTYYYQLSKLNRVVPGTVVKIDTNTQDVYLSNGTVLSKSVFADAVDGTFMPNAQVNAPYAFNTYNFTLDEEGNYIFWEPIANTSTFVYGTYLDYTTPLNSSSYVYSMVGVDKNGEQTLNTVTKYSFAATPSTYVPFGNTTNYTANPLPKRDASNLSGFVQEGQYVGYVINGDGELTAVTTSGGTADQPFIQAGSGDFETGATTIGERDVLIGAKAVGTSSLFLTENTVFHIVSGAGTDTQDVKTYHGLSELMKGNDSVTIKQGTVLSTLAAGSVKAGVPLQDMIYYTESNFTYAQDYTGSATQATVLFLPAEAIDITPSVQNNLVFVGDSDSTLINAYGEPATQFTMYANGEGRSIWIQGLTTDATSDAKTIATLGDNVFYRVSPTDKKAMDGQIIYEIKAVPTASTAADDVVIGKYYDGTLSVAYTTNPGSGNIAKYSATTYNSQAGFISANAHTGTLYNVSSAKVVNLNTTAYPGIVNTLATLNQAGSLTTNAGVPVSCVLSADSTAVVSVIYVNA